MTWICHDVHLHTRVAFLNTVIVDLKFIVTSWTARGLTQRSLSEALEVSITELFVLRYKSNLIVEKRDCWISEAACARAATQTH